MPQLTSVLDTMMHAINNGGNNIRRYMASEGTRASNDKGFTELVLFDKRTFQMLQPFISGRYIFVVGEMPRCMEMLYPKETSYMKVLMSTCTYSIQGFADETMEVDTVNAATDQNTADYVTKLVGATRQIDIQFMTEYTSLVITNYITTWMHLIYSPGSTASSYPHLTYLEYNEGNHSMTAVYVITNPSYQTVEIGAVFYGGVPLGNAQSTPLNATQGTHDFFQISIPFKVHTYTTALPNVYEICKMALDDYVSRTALIDFRVQRKPQLSDFQLTGR